jgi:heme/copper-type cytochrome/quinol oxidase subunit 2
LQSATLSAVRRLRFVFDLARRLGAAPTTEALLNRLRSLVIAALALAAAIVLFIVLRPGDDGESTTTTAAETTTTTPTTTAATTTKPKPPTLTRVTIHVRHGGVLGGIRRVTVPRGRPAELYVTSDVADHVHLHGYDIMRDVAPGAPARLRFRATTAGRFEVELEDRALQIAEITVQA